MSIGIERIFAILEAQQAAASIQSKTLPTQVLVASLGGSLLSQRLSICMTLRSADIPTETPLKNKIRLYDTFEYVEKNQIPILILFGEDELSAGSVRIKRTYIREDKGHKVPLDKIVEEVKSLLANNPSHY